jgi:hypothetical protein
MKKAFAAMFLLSIFCLKAQEITFARTVNDTVVDVVTIPAKECKNIDGSINETKGILFCQSLWGNKFQYVRTCVNKTVRKNYAGQGFSYDKVRDAFISPKPEGNYILDEGTCQWKMNK